MIDLGWLIVIHFIGAHHQKERETTIEDQSQTREKSDFYLKRDWIKASRVLEWEVEPTELA